MVTVFVLVGMLLLLLGETLWWSGEEVTDASVLGGVRGLLAEVGRSGDKVSFNDSATVTTAEWTGEGNVNTAAVRQVLTPNGIFNS